MTRTTRCLPALSLCLLALTGCSRATFDWVSSYRQRSTAAPKVIKISEVQQRRNERIWFIHKNRAALEPEAHGGSGDQLDGLAARLGCEHYAFGHFATTAKHAAQELFEFADATTVNTRFEALIEREPNLRRACRPDNSEVIASSLTPRQGRTGSLQTPRRALVLPLKTLGDLPKETGEILTGIILSDLGAIQNLEVLGPKDVSALLSMERDKDLLGCDDVVCASELGGALGSDLVLHGTVSRLGGRFVVVLNAIDTRTIRVPVRVRRMAPAAVEMLPGVVEDVTSEMVMRLESTDRRRTLSQSATAQNR